MSRWGVYIHLPYCKSICPYCDFNSYVQPKADWAALLRALQQELASRRALMPDTPAQSLYFGGGTPSMAPPEMIATLVADVRRTCGLVDEAEITLECNPGTVDVHKMRGFLQGGINRISLGWQSTHDRLLRVLGRGHSAQDSQDAWQAARDAGAEHISVDLIFAVPGQSDADLEADLARLVDMAPEHVSLYALTYKQGTPFYRRRMRGTLTPATEETECRMMRRIEAVLTAHGYEHYEVSNYAKPNKRARHNSLYWQGAMYLGLGPGAHSFMHQDWQAGWRWENARAPAAYTAAWPAATIDTNTSAHANMAPAAPQEGDASVNMAEALSAKQLFAERMLCGLRQTDGVSLDEPICRAHAKLTAQASSKAMQHGWAHMEGTWLRPTPLGLAHADALAALFF